MSVGSSGPTCLHLWEFAIEKITHIQIERKLELCSASVRMYRGKVIGIFGFLPTAAAESSVICRLPKASDTRSYFVFGGAKQPLQTIYR